MPDQSVSNIAAADALTLLLNNQHALGAAIEEITKWLSENGMETIADNAVGAMKTLDTNAQMLTDTIMRLRLAHFLEDETTLLTVLDALHERVAEPQAFDVEYYRQHRTFDDIEYAGIDVALKAIDVRAALASANPARGALRAWDLADQYQRRARVLARNGRDEEARTAALQAVGALRSAGPDQDIDAGGPDCNRTHPRSARRRRRAADGGGGRSLYCR